MVFTALPELSSVVQRSADIGKEPNENSKRHSTLTLVSYVFPSNSSSNSSPWSTNISENQTGHTVGCQRVRSNKKIPKERLHIVFTALGKVLALRPPLGALCVCPSHRNLLTTPVSRWGCHSRIKAGWPLPCCVCTWPLLVPFLCGVFSIRNFHSPWPLFSHVRLSDTRPLFHLDPKDGQEGKQTEGTSVHFLTESEQYFYDFVALQKMHDIHLKKHKQWACHILLQSVSTIKAKVITGGKFAFWRT